MCQMCEEYEYDLIRMGLLEDAKKFREEREREHAEALARRDRASEAPMIESSAKDGGGRG